MAECKHCLGHRGVDLSAVPDSAESSNPIKKCTYNQCIVVEMREILIVNPPTVKYGKIREIY